MLVGAHVVHDKGGHLLEGDIRADTWAVRRSQLCRDLGEEGSRKDDQA